MTHALTTHFSQRNFYTTLFTNNATVLKALVLSAQALVVLYWTKDLGTEKTITLRLERTVIDGLGLLHFAKGPGTDHLGRGQTDTNGIELFELTLVFQQIQQVFQGLSSSRTRHDRLDGHAFLASRVIRFPIRYRYRASEFP